MAPISNRVFTPTTTRLLESCALIRPKLPSDSRDQQFKPNWAALHTNPGFTLPTPAAERPVQETFLIGSAIRKVLSVCDKRQNMAESITEVMEITY